MPVWHNQRTLCNCFMATPGSLAVTEDCPRRPAPPRPPGYSFRQRPGPLSAPLSARFRSAFGWVSAALSARWSAAPQPAVSGRGFPAGVFCQTRRRLPGQSGHRPPSLAPVPTCVCAVPCRFRPLTCVIGPQAPTVKLLRQDRQQFSLQNLHQSRRCSGTGWFPVSGRRGEVFECFVSLRSVPHGSVRQRCSARTGRCSVRTGRLGSAARAPLY